MRRRENNRRMRTNSYKNLLGIQKHRKIGRMKKMFIKMNQNITVLKEIMILKKYYKKMKMLIYWLIIKIYKI